MQQGIKDKILCNYHIVPIIYSSDSKEYNRDL